MHLRFLIKIYMRLQVIKKNAWQHTSQQFPVFKHFRHFISCPNGGWKLLVSSILCLHHWAGHVYFFFFPKESRKWKSLCCSTACVRGNGVPICTHITIFATLKFRVFYKDTMTKIVLRNNQSLILCCAILNLPHYYHQIFCDRPQCAWPTGLKTVKHIKVFDFHMMSKQIIENSYSSHIRYLSAIVFTVKTCTTVLICHIFVIFL